MKRFLALIAVSSMALFGSVLATDTNAPTSFGNMALSGSAGADTSAEDRNLTMLLVG